MVRKFAGLTALLGILVGCWVGAAEVQTKSKAAPPADAKANIMKQKLEQAQKLLEGLALGDFTKLGKAAEELALIRNKAGWMVKRTAAYEQHSNDFQREMEAMQKAVKAKNLDGAALAYVEMTLTCVKCHQHVREEGVGQAPRLTLEGLAFVRR